MFRLFLVLLLMSVSLTACNTTHGFGQDVENVGEGIQKATK